MDSRSLNEWLFPLRISTQLGQIVCLHYVRIREEYEKEITDARSVAERPPELTVSITDLPTSHQDLIARRTALRTELKTVEDELKSLDYGLWDIDRGVILKSETVVSKNERHDRSAKMLTEAHTKRERRLQALRGVARQMAEVRIKKTEDNIPQELRKQLDEV